MKDAMMSQEQQSVEHAKLEMEAKAQEEKVRKELQLKSAELAATNKALSEATSQNHSEKTDTSPLSPVSFQDSFLPTDSVKPEGAGMAALRRVRANMTKPPNTEAEKSTDLKATTAALQKLRAITAAKASGSSGMSEETSEISPKSPVVLHAAAQRAKVESRILGMRMHPLCS